MSDTKTPTGSELAPLTPGFLPHIRFDILSGFLVFLIAMPLCLAISRASGFPPIAGIWTAVLGGIIATMVSNSEMTIKGPAAGLIVIVFGAVSSLGKEFGPNLPDDERAFLGYQLALGVGVAAGIAQVLFGFFRAGRLVDLFPLTPVHGMLSSIGIIIIAKQGYEAMGAAPEWGGPLTLLFRMPGSVLRANPEIAIIGLVSLIILFGLPWINNKWVKRIPAQLVVLIIAIGLGMWFDLDHRHVYLFPDIFQDIDIPYEIGPEFLVTIPNVLQNPSSAFMFPDFRGLATVTGLQYFMLFLLIGSLESLLSAKAIDLLDPWRRKTDFNRDLIAIGLANTASALIGGLPMISEIVRSSANINNGARTRFANFYHGLFLLLFVLLAPNLIHSIPLAALGAMLVFTGFRLASPKEFLHTFRIGRGQFLVFISTIIVTLATDLLIGIAAGIALEIALNFWHGALLRNLYYANIKVVAPGSEIGRLVIREAAVFSNWLAIRDAITKAAAEWDEFDVDLCEASFVDHSVMEKLRDLERELTRMGKKVNIKGLDTLKPLSGHPLSARKRTMEPVEPVAVG